MCVCVCAHACARIFLVHVTYTPTQRYYNMLLSEWIQRYRSAPQLGKGISRSGVYCVTYIEVRHMSSHMTTTSHVMCHVMCQMVTISHMIRQMVTIGQVIRQMVTISQVIRQMVTISQVIRQMVTISQVIRHMVTISHVTTISHMVTITISHVTTISHETSHMVTISHVTSHYSTHMISDQSHGRSHDPTDLLFVSGGQTCCESCDARAAAGHWTTFQGEYTMYGPVPCPPSLKPVLTGMEARYALENLPLASIQYCREPKNEQARISPNIAYQCIHGDSTAHRLSFMKNKFTV